MRCPNAPGTGADRRTPLPPATLFLAGKPVLVAFNAAQYATQLEQKTAAQVKDEYMGVLKKLFGAANVPEPISVRLQRGARHRPGYLGHAEAY